MVEDVENDEKCFAAKEKPPWLSEGSVEKSKQCTNCKEKLWRIAGLDGVVVDVKQQTADAIPHVGRGEVAHICADAVVFGDQVVYSFVDPVQNKVAFTKKHFQ